MEIEESSYKSRLMSTLQFFFPSKSPAVQKLIAWKQSDEDVEWAEKAIEVLVKKLRRKRVVLDELIRAVSNPGCTSGCVTIPRSMDGRLQVGHRKGLPHVMFCKLWRWSDLHSHHELAGLECCQFPFAARKLEICVNPYHYKRLKPPNLPAIVVVPNSADSPTVDAGNFSAETFHHHPLNGRSAMPHNVSLQYSSSQPNYNGPTSQLDGVGSYPDYASVVGSYAQPSITPDEDCSAYEQQQSYSSEPTMTTMGNLANVHNKENMYPMSQSLQNAQSIAYQEPRYWASIAYYELNSRVGELFQCSRPVITVDGFTDPSNGSDRFCLGKLSNVNRNSTIENTRRHIGKGVQLHYVAGEVYAECHSDHAIFVQSGNRNFESSFHPSTVIKMPSTCHIKIFDNVLFAELLKRSVHCGFEAAYELTKMCTIRMSFVKGWGAEYHRQDVTSTPCWIEIHLNGPLKWLDSVLTNMGKPHNAISSVS